MITPVPFGQNQPIHQNNLQSTDSKQNQPIDVDTSKVNQMQSVINSEMKQVDSTQVNVSKEKIERSGLNSETQSLRENIGKTEQFLSALVAFIKTMISYLNIFAYFYKKPEQTSLNAEKIAPPETNRAPSPENLSRAANLLISTLGGKEENLKEEGIFRISGSKRKVDEVVKWTTGSSASVHTLAANEQRLIKEGIFKSPENKTMTDELAKWVAESSSSVHELTGALKEVFGQMKLFGSPALKENFLELGMEIDKLDEEEKINKMKQLVGQLQDQQQKDLKTMLGLLGKVVEYKDVNKMAAKNLAIVFGPRLVYIENPLEFAQATKQITALTESLITYQKQLFG